MAFSTLITIPFYTFLCDTKEVKLSSLEYALIPSTKISIHSIEMRLPLELSLSTRPDYPYVSKLRMSLANTPDCKLRITPLSNDR